MAINYLLLKNILIRNANALSGALIVGFPAVTAWLGFVHALERKMKKCGFSSVRFNYAGIICHHCHLQLYAEPGEMVYSVLNSRKPPDKKGRNPSLTEEAYCHLNVSLFICGENIKDKNEEVITAIPEAINMLKIAGGILPIQADRRQVSFRIINRGGVNYSSVLHRGTYYWSGGMS